MKELIICLFIPIIFFGTISVTEDACTGNRSNPTHQNTQYAPTITGTEPKNNAQEQQNPPNYSPNYGSGMVPADRVNIPKPLPHEKDTNSSARQRKEQYEKSLFSRFWEDPTAVVTLGLVVATCLLACSSLFQAWLFRKELILTQRPKMRVRNIIITNPIDMGKPIEGRLTIVNVGGTPAKKINVGCWARRELKGKHRWSGEKPYKENDPNYRIDIRLTSGDPHVLEFRDEGTLIGEKSFKDTGPLDSVYVMGYVEYVDDIGTPRRTGFCRRYRKSKDRFFAVDDPDYEYED
jgi:hypothetical protein